MFNVGSEDGFEDGCERDLFVVSVGEDDGVLLIRFEGWSDGTLLGDIIGTFDALLFIAIFVIGDSDGEGLRLLDFVKLELI